MQLELWQNATIIDSHILSLFVNFPAPSAQDWTTTPHFHQLTLHCLAPSDLAHPQNGDHGLGLLMYTCLDGVLKSWWLRRLVVVGRLAEKASGKNATLKTAQSH